MFVLLGYLLGLGLLSLCLRKRNQNTRNLVIVAYNYLFLTALYTAERWLAHAGLAASTNILFGSLYDAVGALAFDGDHDLSGGLPYTLIFLFSSVYTVRAVLVMFFRQAANALTLGWRILWKRDIYIVWGDTGDSRILCRDIQDHVRRAAIVHIPYAEEDGSSYLPGSLERDESFLENLKARKNYHIVLLPDRFHNNIRRLRKLDELGLKHPNLHVTAYLDNRLLRLEDLCFPHLDAYLVSREQLLVRTFLSEHLPLALLQERECGQVEKGIFVPDAPFSLCMVGFGPLAEEYLLSVYENTAFRTSATDGQGLNALILGNGFEQARVSFLSDYPQLAQEPGLSWLETLPDSPAYFEAIKNRLPGLCQILIDTGDTQQNINAAMRLLRQFRRLGMTDIKPQLIVALHEESGGSIDLLAEEKGVFFQQVNRSQYTWEDLVLRRADAQADAIHRRYNAKSLHTENWRELTVFTQDSNRAVVRDIPNKLLLSRETKALSGEEREAALWELAQYEHRRWNAFHFARGWTPLPPSELTSEELSRRATKRPQERRHICLVAWDELDALPQNPPGILKQYDYENVAALFPPDRNSTFL